MRIGLPQTLEGGRVRRGDGIVSGFLSISPAVEDDEGNSFLVHGGDCSIFSAGLPCVNLYSEPFGRGLTFVIQIWYNMYRIAADLFRMT